MSVRKATAYVPFSDEAIVDHAIGTEADQDAASTRIEARHAEQRARWDALPWYIRLRVRLAASVARIVARRQS
jgi:hypothetical protein